MADTHKQGAFTLIELLVVIAIIALLASVVLVALNEARKKSRDARRLADMRQIQTALDMYLDKNGSYPNPSSDASCAGWDTTADGTFVPALKSAGIVSKDVADPMLNSNCGNYRYYRYAAGSNGCDPAQGQYYVLGVVTMETSNPAAYPSNPGFFCSGRNWTVTSGFDQLQWVTGKFER